MNSGLRPLAFRSKSSTSGSTASATSATLSKSNNSSAHDIPYKESHNIPFLMTRLKLMIDELEDQYNFIYKLENKNKYSSPNDLSTHKVKSLNSNKKDYNTQMESIQQLLARINIDFAKLNTIISVNNLSVKNYSELLSKYKIVIHKIERIKRDHENPTSGSNYDLSLNNHDKLYISDKITEYETKEAEEEARKAKEAKEEESDILSQPEFKQYKHLFNQDKYLKYKYKYLQLKNRSMK